MDDRCHYFPTGYMDEWVRRATTSRKGTSISAHGETIPDHMDNQLCMCVDYVMCICVFVEYKCCWKVFADCGWPGVGGPILGMLGHDADCDCQLSADTSSYKGKGHSIQKSDWVRASGCSDRVVISGWSECNSFCYPHGLFFDACPCVHWDCMCLWVPQLFHDFRITCRVAMTGLRRPYCNLFGNRALMLFNERHPFSQPCHSNTMLWSGCDSLCSDSVPTTECVRGNVLNVDAVTVWSLHAGGLDICVSLIFVQHLS